MARRARSARERRRGGGTGIAQLPRRQVRNPYPPMEIFSADEIEAIHQASLAVLRDTGMNFLLPEAVEVLRQAGADIADDGVRVRFDPDKLAERYEAGDPLEELVQQGSA